MISLVAAAQNWLNQYLPTNNTRAITAIQMRNSLLNTMPIRQINWVQSSLTHTVLMTDFKGYEICFDILMEMSGAKVLNVPTDFPERLQLTVVNTSNSGDITFTLPSGVWQYDVNQVFTVRPNTAGAVTQATLPNTFRGSASFVRMGSGKWYRLD